MLISLAQQDADGVGIVAWLIYIAVVVFVLIGMWRVFEKAGKPGWAALIPLYNIWVMFEIAGRPGWWLFLAFIPFVNVVVIIISLHVLSGPFGHGVGFTLGLIFLPMIFWMILGYGDSQYRQPA